MKTDNQCNDFSNGCNEQRYGALHTTLVMGFCTHCRLLKFYATFRTSCWQPTIQRDRVLAIADQLTDMAKITKRKMLITMVNHRTWIEFERETWISSLDKVEYILLFGCLDWCRARGRVHCAWAEFCELVPLLTSRELLTSERKTIQGL